MFDGFFRGLQRLGGRDRPDESSADELRILLHGRENFPFEVVGCGRCQAELRQIMAAHDETSRRRACLAELHPDIVRAAGASDIRVMVEGSLVGYFPRYLSTRYREWLDAWKLGDAEVYCRVLILHEPGKADPAAGEFRVKLDIEIPFKMTALQF